MAAPSSVSAADATSYLATGTTVDEVRKALLALGFEDQARGDYAYVAPPVEDERTTPVHATIRALRSGRIRVVSHSSIWRSPTDNDLHNALLDSLQSRFGGSFRTNRGRNAPVTCDRPYRFEAEAAAYKAYANFETNHSSFLWLAENISTSTPKLPPGVDWTDPRIYLSHALLPFLTTTAEEYLRSTYVGLLRYSPRKATVLRTVRALTGDDLARISEGATTVERAVAQQMGFQTLDRIVASFRDVDPNLDISAPLKRPYRKRAPTLFESIATLFERRHAFVHSMRIDPKYEMRHLVKDGEDLFAGLDRVYKHLLVTYGWAQYDY